MSWGYGTLASEVYDLDKPIGSSFGDVEFYSAQLDGVDGRVLEPAVGTGRILIPLLQAGIAVDGYDNSPAMLAVCQRRCSERSLHPVLFEADMTSYKTTQQYAAVIVPTGSIALLDGRDALARTLKGFSECLEPSGHLLVDVGAPQLLSALDPMRNWMDGPTVWTLQTMHVEYDASKNQTTRWLRYEKWTDGVLAATELQIFRLQHWSIPEFVGSLRDAGFVDVTVTADYSPDGQPGSDSAVWTFHGVRR